jgi:hypothetical protein
MGLTDAGGFALGCAEAGSRFHFQALSGERKAGLLAGPGRYRLPRHRCRLNYEMRVWNALTDILSNICRGLTTKDASYIEKR